MSDQINLMCMEGEGEESVVHSEEVKCLIRSIDGEWREGEGSVV